MNRKLWRTLLVSGALAAVGVAGNSEIANAAVCGTPIGCVGVRSADLTVTKTATDGDQDAEATPEATYEATESLPPYGVSDVQWLANGGGATVNGSGCPEPKNGTGAWRIMEILYDTYGCKVPLRYGDANWGYRHIVDVHSWGSDAHMRTNQALGYGYRVPDKYPSSIRHCFGYTSDSGKKKVWRTIVQYAAGKGIINSFSASNCYPKGKPPVRLNPIDETPSQPPCEEGTCDE